jgi:ribonuclease P protein component
LSARETNATFGFGPDRRLSRSDDFERLMKEGTRRSQAGFVFFFAPRKAGVARLGILISRRHAALASDRNRIKRCIREAFRLEHRHLASIDVLVRPPYGLKPGVETARMLREQLLRLGK